MVSDEMSDWLNEDKNFLRNNEADIGQIELKIQAAYINIDNLKLSAADIKHIANVRYINFNR